MPGVAADSEYKLDLLYWGNNFYIESFPSRIVNGEMAIKAEKGRRLREGPAGRLGPGSEAFLLAQVGAWAAEEFGARLEKVGLSRSEAGLLWIVDGNEGASQQDLANRVGIAPSRMVALLDGLADRDLVRRVRSSKDRRVSTVELTDVGRELLDDVAALAQEHNRCVCASLDDDQRDSLAQLLRQVADQAGLRDRVHPRQGQEGPG